MPKAPRIKIQCFFKMADIRAITTVIQMLFALVSVRSFIAVIAALNQSYNACRKKLMLRFLMANRSIHQIRCNLIRLRSILGSPWQNECLVVKYTGRKGHSRRVEREF